MELFDQVGLDADTVRRLLESKIDSSSLFFALTEQELKTEFLIPFHALVKFRLARHQFELSSMVQLSAGLLGALPEFKGRGNRALEDPAGFMTRFEAVLESANVPMNRWSSLVTLCLTSPEDTAYWRAFVDKHRYLSWQDYRLKFLQHFEKFDQRSKYIKQLSQLKQKPGERVQAYMDRAMELVRRAGVSTRDRLFIDGVRRGLFHQELKSFLTYREKPDQPYTISELMELCLLGEDRLGLEPSRACGKEYHPKPAEERPASEKRCRRCKRRGHDENTCWKKKSNQPGGKPIVPQLSSSTPTIPKRLCKNCLDATHTFSECPKNTCALCKQTGHRDYACPTAKCTACGLKGHTAHSFSCHKHPKHKVSTTYDP